MNFVSESAEERLYIEKNLSSGWRNRRLEYFFERVNMLMYLKSGLENILWVTAIKQKNIKFRNGLMNG